jgi:hypothetical protein
MIDPMAKAKTRSKSAQRAIEPSMETEYKVVSATVPRSIVDEARLCFSKRDFSKFVSRAMARELVRIAREEYVEEAEKIRPVDDADLARMIAILTS